ncbi:MAG: AAA family ATPase [Hydrotalea sp. AMD]|uniref:ATP-binding protein n=1 Tax=Hydrotalea sp. AMD TaxID=2501297 RepID=UPI001025F1BF|nr:AAA family ATPase [Hydrotalea sp. AMD]RWZ87267.1 MAG: AAA family ATPase [Hydrotalea sp. AMD]
MSNSAKKSLADTAPTESSNSTVFEVADGVQLANPNKSGERPAFQITSEKEGNKVVTIFSEQLRRFIWDQIDDQNLITSHHLYKDDDDETTKAAKDRMVTVTADVAIHQWIDWYDEYRQNIFDSLYSRHEAIIDDITKFGEALTSLRDELVAEASEIMEKGVASFSKLYFALRQPDLQLCIEHEHTLIAGNVKSCQYNPGGFFNAPHLRVELTIYSHNGANLICSSYWHVIPQYTGELNMTDLGLIKLTDEVKEKLISRGKKYVEMTSKPSYLAYSGEIVRRSYWNDLQFRSIGRVMIDLTAMKSIDSNYSFYFAMDRDSNRRNQDNGSNVELSDDVFMCMSPYVYGFSFAAKIWGEMKVEDLTDIVFREDAYDMLVLPQDTKDMLAALVETNNIVGKDFIDGKGGGCIFLLAGTPGVGKTLTAEAIAEKLQQPLYMVGIGELGTNVTQLEKKLRDILDIASSWKAVLLLDEADIFMEKRDDINIERNAMVGIFLRLLEYYQGTLFLTTNRAKTIDEAFYSRISLAIKYDDLDMSARTKIWTNILNLYQLPHIDVERLSHYAINGRQIKNVTRIVTSLADTKSTVPTTDDFVKVIDHVVKFNMN